MPRRLHVESTALCHATTSLRREIAERSAEAALTFSVAATFCELYNDDVLDLLDRENSDKDIRMRDDFDGSLVVTGLREVRRKHGCQCSSCSSLAALLSKDCPIGDTAVPICCGAQQCFRC